MPPISYKKDKNPTTLSSSNPNYQSRKKTKEIVNSTTPKKNDNPLPKKIESDQREQDRVVTSFNHEHELGNIMIHILLTKLAKNPIYQKQTDKLFSGTMLVDQLDTPNISNEYPIVKCRSHIGDKE